MTPIARLALRLAAAPLALVIASGALTASATAQADVGSPAADTSSARGAAPSATRAEDLGKWRCKKFTSPSVVGKTCARFSVFNERFDVDYTRTVKNNFRKKTIDFQCSTSKQTTTTFSVSATVKAEAGVIFAKAEASATAGVQRSYTTTDSVSANFKVKPRQWAHCKRGTYVYEFRGEVKRIRCNASGCRNSRDSFRGKAPSRDLFLIGPGRG